MELIVLLLHSLNSLRLHLNFDLLLVLVVSFFYDFISNLHHHCYVLIFSNFTARYYYSFVKTFTMLTAECYSNKSYKVNGH